MRPVMIGLFLTLLAACNTPGPAFRGIVPVHVTVGESRFAVRTRGTRAQALRLTTEWAPRLAAVAPHAVAAIEAVSGCTVARLDGDAALVTARLDCGAGPPPMPPPRALDCELYKLGAGYGEMLCRPLR
jgi:hypothetical protein